MKNIYYHGTSDIFKIPVLLPASQTGNLREDWRKKYVDKVFFTTSLMSAQMYAKKAALKYGGNPVVYQVKPVGDVWNPRENEYIAGKAKVEKVVWKKEIQ